MRSEEKNAENEHGRKHRSVFYGFLAFLNEIYRVIYRQVYRFVVRYPLWSFLILAVLLYFFLEYVYYPGSITVSGNLNVGPGIEIKQLAFYNSTNDTVGQITLDGAKYSASMPNQDNTYKVVGHWMGFSWQQGITSTTIGITKTTFGLDGTINQNLNLPTPASVIHLSGSVKVGAIAQKIVFTPINQSFTIKNTSIQPLTGSYNITLPNLVTYNVSLNYANVTLFKISSTNVVCDSDYHLKEGNYTSDATHTFTC